jgi:hypothetical protein
MQEIALSDHKSGEREAKTVRALERTQELLQPLTFPFPARTLFSFEEEIGSVLPNNQLSKMASQVVVFQDLIAIDGLPPPKAPLPSGLSPPITTEAATESKYHKTREPTERQTTI